MFAKIRLPNSNENLLGKIIFEGTNSSLVEFFRDPKSGVRELEISNHFIQKSNPPDQTVIFYPSDNGLAWDHSFFERNSINNRENAQLLEKKFTFDIGRYLLGHSYSSHASYLDKQRFLGSVLSQRRAALGVQSILPSNVNLEEHQMEVARRFLEDPLQRYILADEVGLGKTIEAGFIIKQVFFDLGFKAKVLICCPRSLKKQWKMELTDRFYLGKYIDHGLIEIIEHSDLSNSFVPQNYDFLVIDEAHKVMPRSRVQTETETFRKIRKLSNMSRRLLLLSATPALHNEFGFLSMLSLVDPVAYRLDDIDDFKQKVSRRESIASIIVALTPENFDFLSMTLDRIRDENLGDEGLLVLVDRLDDLTLEVDENDQLFLKTLYELKGYLSETYKLNRRVIRNRRSNLRYITQNRGGVEAKLYPDKTGNTANFFEQFRSWAAEQITIDDETDIAKVSEVFMGLRSRLYNLNGSSWGALDWKVSRPDYVKDQNAIRPIIEFIKSNRLFEKRCLALIRFLKGNLAAQEKALVFVSDIKTADGIHSRLNNDGFQSIRHNPDDEGWRIFNTSNSSAVLVCDERAEEGLNIQGDRKKIFHFDLPFNANRIEQRIGRVDRYGEESPVVCHVRLCHEDNLEVEWFKFLKNGLHIFDNSVASLQYLIEDELNDVAFRISLLEEGASFINTLKKAFGGQEGKTQLALRSLDQQDSLEELTDPPEQLFYGARDLDADFEKTERGLMPWLENHLELSRKSMEGQRFELRYNDGIGAAFGSTGGKNSRIPKNHYDDIVRRTGSDGGFSFDREYCLKTDGNVPSLMRYGNSFFDSLYQYTSETPLGSVSGMWRYTPTQEGVNSPQIFFKNTFLVEADIDFIVDQLTNDPILKDLTNLNVIKRRCDGLFPPETLTNWITYNDELLTDLAVKAYLEDEPNFQTEFETSGFDIEIYGPANGVFAEIILEQTIDWISFCNDLLAKGEAKVRDNLSDRFKKDEISIIAQMDKRLNRYKSILDNESLKLETNINNLIMHAIKRPKVSLISNLMVCMTSDLGLTNKMLSGGADN